MALGIRLHPEGAIRLLGQPVEALRGQDADLADLLSPREADELLDRCEGAGDAMARIGVAVRWLEERMARGRAAPRGVEAALLRLREAGGRIPISSLAEDSGWSRSRFSTRFREEVGISPKTYARVLRFHGALEALQGVDPGAGRRGSHETAPDAWGSPSLLSCVAFRAGYADQAHFTREFGEFAGTTPAAWLRRRSFPDSTSTPEPASG